MNMISVSEMLNKYPNIRLATQADNDEILEFTKSVPMRAGAVSLRYERGPNYFDQTKLQGDSAFVLVIVADGKIAGVTAISVKRTYCNGSAVKAGYFSDLRVQAKLPTHIRTQWRNVYFELINNFSTIAELCECSFLYSVLLNENDRMLKIFKNQSAPVSHEKIDEFWTYNLLGRLPVPFRMNNSRLSKQRGMKVRRATVDDIDALKEHLKHENEDRVLGHYFSDDDGDEFGKRMTRWANFDISSFIITEDCNNKIVGCVYPWSASRTKRLIVESLPKAMAIVGKLMPFLGKPSALIGHELKVLYLTHLEITSSYSDQERQAIFELMLRFIYKHKIHIGYHMMSFSDFPTRPLAPGLKGKGIIANQILSSAFQLVPKTGSASQFRVSPLKGKHIGYELGVV